MFISACKGQKQSEEKPGMPGVTNRVKTGAERFIQEKLPSLKGKRIAVVANQTSLVFGRTHLVDTLFSSGVNVVKIFGPEHGFRGDHGAGEKVKSDRDAKTGIALVSLYGSTKKPTPDMLKDVDIVLFDIQDVGTRFYTYISTLSYVMEACAEQGKKIIVLDRPNPNGWYTEGPVMENEQVSFVGLHPVPIVHGMTVGEYARMVNGEGWLAGGRKCELTVVECEGYRHEMKWSETGLEWTPPSPNLPTECAAYLYPILCWYEGTPVSVGRGTDFPFQIVGSPWHQGFHDAWMRDSIAGNQQPHLVTLHGLQLEVIRFTPVSIPGKAPSPPFQNQVCYGARFLNRTEGKELFLAGISLLKNFTEEAGNAGIQGTFFQPYFDKLAGNDWLKGKIRKQEADEAIWASWQKDLNAFRIIRSKYLLYP